MLLRIVKLATLGVVAFYVLQFLGITPERVVADSRELLSGNQLERTKQRLQAEAAKLPVAAEIDQGNGGLNQELMAERKRIMEEKARMLEQYGSKIVKGDVESLRQQVEDNARRAGGE